MTMTHIDFKNYKLIALPGCKLIYGSTMGLIEADPAYTDGICCNGRSVKSILEDFNDVFVLGT